VNYLYSGEMIIYQKMHPTVYLNFLCFFFYSCEFKSDFHQKQEEMQGRKGRNNVAHIFCVRRIKEKCFSTFDFGLNHQFTLNFERGFFSLRIKYCSA
jgi:hypothetical protein